MKHRLHKIMGGTIVFLIPLFLVASMETVATASTRAGNLAQLTDSFMGITFTYDRSQWVPSLFADNGDQAPAGVSQRVIGLVDQDTRDMFLISSFNNPQRLTTAAWMKAYDYARTSEPAIYSTSVVDGYPAQIVKELPSYEKEGTPSSIRAILTAHDRIYVVEYASISPSFSRFEDFLSKISLRSPGAYIKSFLRDDLALSFKDAKIDLKPSPSTGINSPQDSTCCSITDPEYNPFWCNTANNKGNCTWWARYRRTGNNTANLYACIHNANTWDDCAAQNYPSLLSSTPLASSVIVWTGATDNHVAFIEHMNANGTFYVSQMGWTQTCPQSYYNSTSSGKVFIHYPGTGDTTPPAINFTSYPALNTWYNTNQRIDWSVSDSSGVWGFSRAWDTTPSGPPPQFSGATSGWLDFTGLGQGQHTVQVRAWDNSSLHNEAVAQLGWLGYDTLAPFNPNVVLANCGAANNVWQNTCTGPTFTWSGANDGNGSGVKDYRYYWGTDPNGAPATYTTTTSFTPSSVPGPVAVQYLRLSTRDNLNQESLPSTAFVFLYDASAPTATLQINHGTATANQVNVTLNLTATDTGSGVTAMRLSGNGVDWTNWQSFTTGDIPWTLPALNRRTTTVYAQVRDSAGNLSGVVSASIYLDLYPIAPNSANYRICQDVMNVGGSPRITSTSYLLASAIGQPSASGMTSNSANFAEQSGFLANVSACLPITYTVTSNYTLTQRVIASGGNLRGSASYRLGDTAGQPVASGAAIFSSTNYLLASGFWAAITGTIPLTTTPPTPVPTHTPTPTPTPAPTATPQPANFGVTINDGALYTNDPQVTVQAWGPNVVQTMLSNDGGFLGAAWQTYQISYTWVLSTYNNTSMPRQVYVQFKDAGNGVYGTYSDDTIYDPVPPQGSVVILDSQIVSTVTLWLDGQDDYSGIADVRLTNDPTTMSTATWKPYAFTVDWDMAGKTVVYAQFRDKAGNLSPVYASDGRVYDPNEKKVYLPLVLK